MKIIYWFLIIIVLYILSIFILPDFTDDIASKIWILSINQKIRNLKNFADNIWENLTEIKSSEEIINKAKDITNTISWSINTTKTIINEKISQTNKVVDSAIKTKDSINELTENISNLTSLSWSTNSWTQNTWTLNN